MPAADRFGVAGEARAPCWIGIDLGTSGCRAVAIDAAGALLAAARASLPPSRGGADGGREQDPEDWWSATVTVLRDLTGRLLGHRSRALCVDATSATVLLATPDGHPLGSALMYDDRRAVAAAERVAALAPSASPARGASASLAKVLYLRERLAVDREVLVLHQADWVLGRLGARYGISDWNNALKLGFDPVAEAWPDWLDGLALAPVRLPDVVAPGTPIGVLDPRLVEPTGLAAGTALVAGTTDSTAAVIATGIATPGEAVTSLGSTLVVKVLSGTPVADPSSGVYSHRFGDLWLAGGASNSGGAVLRRFFDDDRIAQLSARMDPEGSTGLDYYPLPAPGERFPIADPTCAPRLTPRPADDLMFLQGLFEGIAAIEAAGYRRLAELGAPRPTRILTVGGGAGNSAWARIRARKLGVPVGQARQQEAAYGAARLALTASSGSSRPASVPGLS